MDNSKLIIISLIYLSVFITVVKGYCEYNGDEEEPIVKCKGDKIHDFSVAISGVQNKNRRGTLNFTQTKVVNLPADAAGSSANFQFIYISDNENLKHIEPMAFESSKLTATSLFVENSPLLGNALWDFVAQMPATGYLKLEKVGITEVPVGAFDRNAALSSIRLAHNGVTTFRASLAGLQLKQLDLYDNALHDNSFSDDAFDHVTKLTRVDLTDNSKMTQLNQRQFKGILEAGTIVYVGSGRYGTLGTLVPDSKLLTPYMKCVEADWLCGSNGEFKYKNNLIGYECGDVGTEFASIIEYCKARVPQKTEAQSQLNAEPQSQPKTEEKSQQKAEELLQSKTEQQSQADAEPQPQHEAQPESKTQTQQQPQKYGILERLKRFFLRRKD